jgi:hypothetical protein
MMNRITQPARSRNIRQGNVIYLDLSHRTKNSVSGIVDDWETLTVARIRQQHASGDLNPAILDAMMSAIGLPV